jgi:hypothetical protein
VLDEILLRRTKTTRAEDIQLPPRIVRVRQERLDCRCAVYCNILVVVVVLFSVPVLWLAYWG